MRTDLLIGVLASAVVGTLASASADAQNPEQVKVEASRVVSTKIAGRSSSGVPVVEYSISYGVSLAGLNLATHSGAVEAERRVNAAATAACKEIGRQYPLMNATAGEDCAKTAADKAMVRVREMVASAESSIKR